MNDFYIHKVIWDKSGDIPLVTKINFLSAKILHASRFYGADTIIIHPDIENLLTQTGVYINNKLGVYTVLLDENVDHNYIIMESKKSLNTHFIPILVEKEYPEISEIHMKLIKDNFKPIGGLMHKDNVFATQDEINDYYSKCGGYINIV